MKNLLSIESAFEKDMRIIFKDDGKCIFLKKQLIFKRNKLYKKLYILNFTRIFVAEINVLINVISEQCVM